MNQSVIRRFAFGDASVKLPDDFKRIEVALVERAGKFLERYGTTFYALAAYVDVKQQTREVVAERSTPLHPEAIASAVREAFVRIPRFRVPAAGLILDLPREQKVRIQLEAVSGVCYQLTRSYSFDGDGRVVCQETSTATCASRLYPGN